MDEIAKTIKKLDELRKECVKRANDATDAICVLEQQRERLGEMARTIDNLVIEFYKHGGKTGTEEA